MLEEKRVKILKKTIENVKGEAEVGHRGLAFEINFSLH